MLLQVKAENHIVKQLLQPIGYTVNPTACDGLRSCDTGCDRPDYVLQTDGTGKACAKKVSERFWPRILMEGLYDGCGMCCG